MITSGRVTHEIKHHPANGVIGGGPQGREAGEKGIKTNQDNYVDVSFSHNTRVEGGEVGEVRGLRHK